MKRAYNDAPEEVVALDEPNGDVSMLTADVIMMIFTLVIDRASLCTVCKQWCNLALVTSRLISPVMTLWDGTQWNNEPVYSNLDIWQCPDEISPYQDLHLAQRLISAPCIYRACAAGVHEVIVAVTNTATQCQHDTCLLIFGDDAHRDSRLFQHDVNVILACTHGSVQTVRMLIKKLPTGHSFRNHVDVLLAGLKRAAASGRLPIVRLLLKLIPRDCGCDILEAAAHAYAHINTIGYIIKHVNREYITARNLLPIARAMARCDTTDNIYLFLSKIKGASHESACMLLEGAFWIACGIHQKHVNECPHVFLFGMITGAVHMDNVDLFARLLPDLQSMASRFLIHAGECNSVGVAKYIIENNKIPIAAINEALAAACNGVVTNATADYLSSAGATSCYTCGLELHTHTHDEETSGVFMFL